MVFTIWIMPAKRTAIDLNRSMLLYPVSEFVIHYVVGHQVLNLAPGIYMYMYAYNSWLLFHTTIHNYIMMASRCVNMYGPGLYLALSYARARTMGRAMPSVVISDA